MVSCREIKKCRTVLQIKFVSVLSKILVAVVSKYLFLFVL